jgi:FlaA1/EpsC-like NDP-sugar epimerase/lipopolysaccharide/colanic/teichoic acid biosynthesis glycosyltransferase
MKRLFDIVASLISLIIFSPILLIIAIAIKFDSRGPVFYRGERLGKDAVPFRIFKFRTMVADASRRGGGLTHRNDPRVTRFGKFLRLTKLDELPQLIDVLRGSMSMVGPRPEDPRYLSHYTPRQRKVLSVRPGVTSIASIRYRREEELLSPADWEKLYVESILPAKLDIELKYLSARSFTLDLLILLATPFSVFRDNPGFNLVGRGLRRSGLWLEDRVSWVLIDIALIITAYVLAIAVRSINATLDYPVIYFAALAGVIVYLIANYAFGIYHRFWRYASGQELVVVFLSVACATLILTFIDSLLSERVLPLGAIWLGGFFTSIFLGAARYRRRLSQGIRQMAESLFGFLSGSGARVLIVGAGEEGQLIAWRIQNQMAGQTYRVIGFVDDDRKKQGMRIHNIQVFGDRTAIPELVARLFVDLILIAIPPARVSEPRDLIAICHKTSAQVKVLPGFFDWLKTNGHTPDWVDLTDEDLMQRAEYQADRASGIKLLHDRVVMVTGAAGSIGSELCRQIASYSPRSLILVDVNESGLYDLQVELAARYKDCPTQLILCSITNPTRVEAVYRETRPQIVFHAAAYKHVPILENHPEEAIYVNVLGTRLVHEFAQKYGVERFILISSDKAADPVSVLGLTKRFGELMVATNATKGKMLSAAVRFGNVLGSRGSVVTTFEKQIDLGGPITITHPEMTRYFMSVDEAVNLVIQAAAMTPGGEVYVLDMGVPVSILDLAHRLIRAHGLRPEKDILIQTIGPRPGEKMSEELVAPYEEKIATEHQSIFRIRYDAGMDPRQLDDQVKHLIHLSSNGTTRKELKIALELSLSAFRTISNLAA